MTPEILEELLAACVSGTATPEELERLAAELKDNPEARRLYNRHLTLAGALGAMQTPPDPSLLPEEALRILGARGAVRPQDVKRRRQPTPPPGPVKKISFYARAAAAVLVVTSLALTLVFGVWLNQTSRLYAAAQEQARSAIEERDAALKRLEEQLTRLGIEKAIGTSGPALFPAERDRLGVRVMIDARYIKSVRWRASADSEFKTVYEGPESPPVERQIVVVSESSGELVLDGRVVTAELEVNPYPKLGDTDLARLIPMELRHQRRDFLLAPTGITADPRPIDAVRDIELREVVADADADNVNRYLIFGRIHGYRPGMNAYLIVDATTAGQMWVTSALQPDANGEFVVRAFLGNGARPAAALDRQIYRLFVVLVPDEDVLNEGDVLKKPVNWARFNAIQGPARLKRNDGMDGFIDPPANPSGKK
jgi:hypothetical protein